ncbi:MAG TPA: hypothetical protein VKE22_13795 [Haliangiales bacterium]|nr:hypothetical protein [Haliangiales bacterium]
MRLRLACALLVGALAACGSGSVEGGSRDGGIVDGPFVTPPGLQTIEVMPNTVTLVVDGATPASQTYTAIGHFMDGHTEDLTARVNFLIDNFTLGSFARNVFTSFTGNGGKGRVRAYIGGVEGFGYLTLVIKQRYADPQATGLPGDPTAPFNGPAADARKPDIVYPPDGVLLPPNLGKIEVHFLPGPAANTIFELSFQSDTTDVKIYTSCVNPTNGGCIYLPEAKVWRWLAESNRGSSATVTARATDAGGTGVGTSTSMKMAFSQDDIDGGLYYWTTPKGQPDASFARIYRWDFASTTQTDPEEVITPAQTGGHCVGCHALSPDGRRLFVTSEGSYDADVLLWDLMLGRPMVPWNSTKHVAFASWEWPDGARFVGTFGDAGEPGNGFTSYDLNLYKGDDGSFLETIPVGGSATNRSAQPDWSPDGTMIAFTRIGIPNDSSNNGTTVRGFRTMLRVVKKNGSTWTAPIDLTTSQEGKTNYYPAFSPDSSAILFNRSACADGHDSDNCDMYDDPNASLWVMKPQAGAMQVRQVLADSPGKTDMRAQVQNSFAKWTPFTFQRTGELGQRLFWFTFSSDRNYGLRVPDPGEAQIWMAGFDPDAAARNEDASYPAFFLPFQDPKRDNHTAQWTKRVVRIP